MDKSKVFEIKCYTTKELACLYNPGITPGAATRRLRHWIRIHPTVKNELTKAGWQEGNRLLTPLQVEILAQHLGDP